MNAAGYFIAPATLEKDYAAYCQYSGTNRMFSPPECEAIIALGLAAGFGAARVGSPGHSRTDPLYRKVDVATLYFSPETNWLYQRVTQRVSGANEDFWKFDIVGLLEPFQVLRYKAAETSGEIAGHYDQHQDFGAGYMGRRKISFIAQLSDPETYDGCQLTIQHHFREDLSFVQRGDAVLFPSWTPHAVAPITRGTRFALVTWIHGPPFR